MVSFTALILISLWTKLVAAQTNPVFNVVGLFEEDVHKGAIDDDYEADIVFQKAVDYVKHVQFIAATGTTLENHVSNLANQNAFALSQYVCDTALKVINMGASLGLRSQALREYMHILSQEKGVPYLELIPSYNYSREQVTHMHPDPVEMVDLVNILIQEWRWKKVFFVYESTEALTRHIEYVTQMIDYKLEITSYRIESDSDYELAMESIRTDDSYNIIVDCGLSSIPAFLNKALEMQMLTNKYRYHFLSLDLHVLNLIHYSYGGALITWSQLVNRTSDDAMSPEVRKFETFLQTRGTRPVPKHFYTTHNALIVDAMTVLGKGLYVAITDDPSFSTKSLDCYANSERWVDGTTLRKKINLRTKMKGMTGWIQFTDKGQRINYTVSIMKLQPGGSISIIGEYVSPIEKSKVGNVTWFPREEKKSLKEIVDSYRGKILNITTVTEPPFLVEVNNSEEVLNGNDRYEGYVVELMEKVAEEANKTYDLNLNYRFVLSPNNTYGSTDEDGNWNGMVKEILDGRAGMAVAPLTINHEREKAIDFTKPFMSFGIAILYQVPDVAPPQMMSFIEPIKINVWGTIIVSVVVVSISMYICSRFSPNQWDNPFPCQEDYEYLENPFNLSNAFWFSVGSIMQQGCDIMPTAASTRIVAIAWWLFTLIIVASYTANLAAFLTITTLAESFKSVEELSEQTVVPYGCKYGGNTCLFFERSNISTYEAMWSHMQDINSFVNETKDGIAKAREEDYAFLMESPSLQYQVNTDVNCSLTQVGPLLNSLSYGIGVPEGDQLRDILSSIILTLNDRQVLLELYNKWWKVTDNKCTLTDTTGPPPQLKLQNLQGVFVFLMAGLGVSGLYLIFEILFYAISRSKEEHISVCRMIRIWMNNSVKGTFPDTISDRNVSLERRSTSSSSHLPSNHVMGNNIKAKAQNGIFEEEMVPLTDRVHGSTTADTFVSH